MSFQRVSRGQGLFAKGRGEEEKTDHIVSRNSINHPPTHPTSYTPVRSPLKEVRDVPPQSSQCERSAQGRVEEHEQVGEEFPQPD